MENYSNKNDETYRILTDEDVDRLLTMPEAVAAIRQAFLAKHNGHLKHFTRFSIGGEGGALVFTPGAETESAQAIGFRVYDTFHNEEPGHTQVVAVFNSRTGVLKGLVLGYLLGGLRTAAINAVAIQAMSREDAHVLGVLGSGFQASLHIQAATAVRDFQKVLIYSPNPEHRQMLADTMTEKLGIAVDAASSSAEVVRSADVLICATTSTQPAFEAEWLHLGMHINTIGPKSKEAHELPLEAAQRSQVIATDSLAQVDAYGKPFFLFDTPERKRMVELDEILAGGTPGRKSPQDITLFCSVGLAGTEVVLANRLLELAQS